MPHKHTRKADNKSTINLPPTLVARPLSTSKSAASNGIFTSEISNPKRSGTSKKRRRKDDADDTPKAFARLMAFKAGKILPKGLDDGATSTSTSKSQRKKRKLEAAREEGEEAGDNDEKGKDVVAGKGKVAPGNVPTIKPGERMSEFSARVDAVLPVSGLINKTAARNGKDPLGLKVGRTKTEKRMHRMYDEWREQDRKIKEKREEARELAEEEEMGEDGQVRWKADVDATSDTNKRKGKKGKKKKKVIGELDDGDDDPWAKIREARGEGKVGFNDVVQAPPNFKKVPKEKFKVRGARVEVEDVPKASGSLRRREELSGVRRSVVEGYRAMMKKVKDEAREGE